MPISLCCFRDCILRRRWSFEGLVEKACSCRELLFVGVLLIRAERFPVSCIFRSRSPTSATSATSATPSVAGSFGVSVCFGLILDRDLRIDFFKRRKEDRSTLGEPGEPGEPSALPSRSRIFRSASRNIFRAVDLRAARCSSRTGLRGGDRLGVLIIDGRVSLMHGALYPVL